MSLFTNVIKITQIVDFFISHADDSSLDVQMVIELLESNALVTELVEEGVASSVKARCVCGASDSSGSMADVTVFDEIISLEGYDDAIFEFAVWLQQKYPRTLVLGHPSAPSDIAISNSVQELSRRIDEEWP